MKNTLTIALLVALTSKEAEAVSVKSLVQDDNLGEDVEHVAATSGDEADSEKEVEASDAKESEVAADVPSEEDKESDKDGLE